VRRDLYLPSATPSPRGALAGGASAALGREVNAIYAIAWRELLRAIRSPALLASTIIFPVLFMGILGGSIAQNLGAALPYAYLPFLLVGMVTQAMYQGAIAGVTGLVEERESEFTAELFVAPILRYSVLLGRIAGSGIAAMVALVGIFAMVPVMRITVEPGDLLRVLALAPLMALAGGSLGVLFIGFVQDPKVANVGVLLLIFPQMFLAGVLIPTAASTGILGLLSKLMPMTYSIDLARNIFYAGKPEYAAAVLHSPWLDLCVTAGLFLVFTAVGTSLFVRAERNR
jgi:ABC-2 type transport system permease protein